MIETIRQGLKDDGYAVSISQLCRWFSIPRRTVYYKPMKKAPAVQERFAAPIKQMIAGRARHRWQSSNAWLEADGLLANLPVHQLENTLDGVLVELR